MSTEKQPWQLRHIAVVVRDMDKAIKHYTEIGLCPEGAFRTFDVSAQATYKGHLIPLEMRISLARMGDAQLELIEAREGDNPYWDFLKEKGEGMHHLAFTVDDLDTEVAGAAERGVGILLSGSTGRGGFAYLDSAATGGTYIELMQRV